jgi:hypothetical protein
MQTKLWNYFWAILSSAALVGGLAVPLAAKEAKLKPEELVDKNLASIGTPEARATAKSRVAQGDAVLRLLVGGSGGTSGPVTLVSEGQKVRLLIQFNQRDYHGEEFAYDGKKVTVGYQLPGVRSALEGFIQQSEEAVLSGLFGGTLSTAWPFYDLSGRGAKLEFAGTKNIDGKELYKLSYHPKKGSGNLKIDLYFDPETFRHVKTVYSMTLQSGLTHSDAPLTNSGGGGTAAELGAARGQLPSDQLSARQHPSQLILEEDFSDFKTADGLTLPSVWAIKLSQESDTGSSVQQFQMSIHSIRQNVPLEASIFQIQ